MVNSIINKGASPLAYLDGENVKPFMKAVLAYENTTDAVNDFTVRDELDDHENEKLSAEMFT